MVVWSQQLPREIKKIELLVTSKEKNIGWNLLRREIVFVFSLLYSWYIHSPLLSLSLSLFDREVNEQSSALDERREREFLGGACAFWQRVNRTNPKWAEWAQRIQKIHISIQNCIELEVPSTAHKRRKPGGGHHQPSAFILLTLFMLGGVSAKRNSLLNGFEHMLWNQRLNSDPVTYQSTSLWHQKHYFISLCLKSQYVKTGCS